MRRVARAMTSLPRARGLQRWRGAGLLVARHLERSGVQVVHGNDRVDCGEADGVPRAVLLVVKAPGKLARVDLDARDALRDEDVVLQGLEREVGRLLVA